MTIAFGTIGSKVTTGTTTLALTQPASIAAGDMLVAGRVGWHDTITFADESGWVFGGSTAGGTGTTLDAHTSESRADTREAVGGEGTVTFDQGGTISGVCGLIARYTKDIPGSTWSVVTDGATDNTHGANRATGTSGALSFAPDDLIIAIVAVDTDASLTITAPTFTASGITFGTVNRRTSGAGSGTGNDGNIEIFDALVTAGSASVGVSFAMTTATSQCGPVRFVRLREVPPPAPATLVMAPPVPPPGNWR